VATDILTVFRDFSQSFMADAVTVLKQGTNLLPCTFRNTLQ